MLSINFLKQIIKAQSVLADVHFNFEDYIHFIVHEMQYITPATGALVELVDGQHMVYRAVMGTASKHLGLRLPIENSISGLCMLTNDILSCKDTETDPRVNLEACRRVSARSLIVAPLIHKGKAMGVLKILSNKVNGFKKLDIHTVQLMAGFITSGLNQQILYKAKEALWQENAKVIKQLLKTQKRLKHMATHDVLTGLPNRNLLREHFQHALNKTKRAHTFLALMFIDIDHFKKINDQYGHNIGDKLLIAFSQRIKNCIRASDLLVRLGGDEFILMIEDLTAEQEATEIAQKIIEEFIPTFLVNEEKLTMSISIGITFYQNGDNISPNKLMEKADEALYKAKESGRNNYKVFRAN